MRQVLIAFGKIDKNHIHSTFLATSFLIRITASTKHTINLILQNFLQLKWYVQAQQCHKEIGKQNFVLFTANQGSF